MSLHNTDGYKVDHRSQYPEGTSQVVSNETPRGSRIAGVNKVCAVGLQYYMEEKLIKSWNENFFHKPKSEVVAKYKRRIENYLGEGAITYEHVEALHDLGYLPIKILALAEGTFVPLRVPMLVYYNTLDDFFWLTNYLETAMSTNTWGMCTSATTATRYRKILNKYADLTVGNRDFVPFQGHDFSYRGMFSEESAKMSGFAHLLLFYGTDTIPAIDFAEEYYGANSDKEIVGVSVPATEHSVMCMGTFEDEIGTFERLITKTYPKGIVSIVSDTWDFWRVLTEYLPKLKEKILAREGKVVIRPDSGDPVKIITGYDILTYAEFTGYMFDWKTMNLDYIAVEKEGKYYSIKKNPNYPFEYDEWVLGEEIPEEVVKGAIETMWDTFGGTTTEKGFKLLDSHIGLIYGDSITPERCESICRRLMAKGFCSSNIVLGIGSYTYQYVTRDTFGFAVKATYGVVNGEPRSIFKKPKTDDGLKNSAKGLIAVYYDDRGELYLKDNATWEQMHNCEFVPVFEDGKILKKYTLSEIRERIKEQIG